ncbi:hypothetical protein DSUL_20026 [Desulfovibrionales bacterium]
MICNMEEYAYELMCLDEIPYSQIKERH